MTESDAAELVGYLIGSFGLGFGISSLFLYFKKMWDMV